MEGRSCQEEYGFYFHYNKHKQGVSRLDLCLETKILSVIRRDCIGREQVYNSRINQEGVVVDQAIGVNNLDEAGGGRDAEKQDNLRYILKTECGNIL